MPDEHENLQNTSARNKCEGRFPCQKMYLASKYGTRFFFDMCKLQRGEMWSTRVNLKN